jgi:hypothetical protein
MIRSRRTTTHLYDVETCNGVALAYPPTVIGIENSVPNTGNTPSFPGNTKLKRVISHQALNFK